MQKFRTRKICIWDDVRGMARTDSRQMSASRRRCAFRLCLSNLDCELCQFDLPQLWTKRQQRTRQQRNKKKQNRKQNRAASQVGQRVGSSRKGLNPLDEIVICVFESSERMIRSMFAAAHTIVQRARLTQRRLIIAGLWLGAEF